MRDVPQPAARPINEPDRDSVSPIFLEALDRAGQGIGVFDTDLRLILFNDAFAEFLGIPATNRWVKLRGSSHARFENNQIIEARDHWDIHDLIQQLTRPEETAR